LLNSRDILALGSTNGAGSTELKILGVGGLGPPNVKKNFFRFSGLLFWGFNSPYLDMLQKKFQIFLVSRFETRAF
jgi:hypothetical protein